MELVDECFGGFGAVYSKEPSFCKVCMAELLTITLAVASRRAGFSPTLFNLAIIRLAKVLPHIVNLSICADDMHLDFGSYMSPGACTAPKSGDPHHRHTCVPKASVF